MDLNNVRKPAQYIGNELHSIHKDWDKCTVKVALSYPDTYEIGMSNLGIQILYHILNSQENVLCERVFAPLPDMEEQLKINNEQLTTLESGKPLKEFDLIGFSLGHELTYTNIVNILKLGKIPLYAKDRTDKHPLVMGGGPCVFNPEPIAEFFDFFVIGEAEEVLPKILGLNLEALAKIPGIYVPSIHNKVKKIEVKDLNSVPYPTKPIVPFVSAVHDRVALEIMRGCKWGCKFCQAGWTSRPVRERDKDWLIKTAAEVLKNTGYDEISLVSLSSSDYSKIDELAKTLARKYAKDRINVSVPSLRANTFSVDLIKAISRVRPSGLTIAPEAGTQRLRDVIGKKLTEADILKGSESAFQNGIEAIKLYFMIGLPTETEEDLLEICALARKILELGKKYSKRARITINLATFIPKPHTPLQWEAQISIEQAIERQKFVRKNTKGRGMEVRWHKSEASFLEGVFSRGDKNLSKVIIKAWELGCRLDAWYEHLKFDLWLQAFQKCGIDPNQYLKARDPKKPLPWDYIDVGVAKETLLRVANKS